jgi:hypothetical protein
MAKIHVRDAAKLLAYAIQHERTRILLAEQRKSGRDIVLLAPSKGELDLYESTFQDINRDAEEAGYIKGLDWALICIEDIYSDLSEEYKKKNKPAINLLSKLRDLLTKDVESHRRRAQEKDAETEISLAT